MDNSWTDKKLTYGEEIVYVTRHHWSMLLTPLSLLFLLFVSLWLIIPVIFYLGYQTFLFLSNQFIVTDRRVILKKGLYYIRTEEWPIEKIEEVIYTQSLGDFWWENGTVILLGIAMSKTRFANIWHPQHFRNAIYSQLPADNL